MEIRILQETENYIVADKDRFLAVHGGKDLAPEKTLLFHMRRLFEARLGAVPEYLAPVHRLDLNTRGPVIFALNWPTHRDFHEAFASGAVNKVYEALLEGEITRPLFISADVTKTSHRKAVISHLAISETIPDRLLWHSQRNPHSVTDSATVLRPFGRYKQNTLCRVETWTGRYHQIRAVCEAAGHPVCGDTRYNHSPLHQNRRRTDPQFPDNQVLMCRSISVPVMGLHAESRFDLLDGL